MYALHDTKNGWQIQRNEFKQRNQARGNNSDSPLQIVTYFRIERKQHQRKYQWLKVLKKYFCNNLAKILIL